jgi:hypothetical protein
MARAFGGLAAGDWLSAKLLVESAPLPPLLLPSALSCPPGLTPIEPIEVAHRPATRLNQSRVALPSSAQPYLRSALCKVLSHTPK